MDTTREILLVEDNPVDFELAVRAIRAAGVSNPVRHAADGAEALGFLFGSEGRDAVKPLPAIVLLDLKLQKVGGLDVLEEIKRHAATRSVPVVVLTSSRESCDIQEAYRRGANSYVVKPVEFERFSAALGQLAQYWLQLNELRLG